MDTNNKTSHLQMIQDNITRMGQNSFQIKGWAVGIIIAIFSFAGNQNDIRSILFTVIPLIVLWFLDSYYLLLERKFRLLFDDMRNNNQDNNFNMNFNSIKLKVGKYYKISYVRVLLSITEISFYVTCITTTILIYIFA